MWAGHRARAARTGSISQHFRVMNRAFVRSAVELISSREGTVEVGEKIEALESAVFNGTVRIRFVRG